MSQWYDQFLSLIVSHKQHEFVYDKDQLLTHESLLDAAANAGFVIVGCDTSLDLRIAFELDIRHSDARYLIHSANDFKLLPDIRELMGYAKVTIGDLFPCLNRKTITRLDSRILDVLFTLSKKIFDPLGPDQTIKFVLENIYFVDVDGLGGKERLLSSLTTIFSEPYTLNQPVLEFLSKRFWFYRIKRCLILANIAQFCCAIQFFNRLVNVSCLGLFHDIIKCLIEESECFCNAVSLNQAVHFR